MFLLIVLQAFSFSFVFSSKEIIIDANGYLMFCPCMGRFGNQIDQMLGSFVFAKALNRTIVVPPFINFKNHGLNLVPFENIFKIKELANLHRIITMEEFMSKIAASLWPSSKRSIFCYSERPVVFKSTNDGGCNAKDGNPFQFFWDQYNIDFFASNFYEPLNFNLDENNIQTWKDTYNVTHFPVLAFVGAPSNFPSSRSVRFLQKYFLWSDNITSQADEFLNDLGGPILGLHLRQGIDWERVCKNLKDFGTQQIFGSAQCLGDDNELAHKLTKLMCQPDWKEIITRIELYIETKAIKTIFLATDNDIISHPLNKHFNNSVNIVKYRPSNLYVDLNILSRMDYYIGNCVSTFSAVATYDRLIHNLPVDFWGLYPDKREEL